MKFVYKSDGAYFNNYEAKSGKYSEYGDDYYDKQSYSEKLSLQEALDICGKITDTFNK